MTLAYYPALSTVNPQFEQFDLGPLDRFYLPPCQTGLVDEPAAGTVGFLEDDNRGAVSAEPIAVVDGVEFHLSIKGVGSTIDPYSSRALDRADAVRLAQDARVRERLVRPTVPSNDGEPDRIVTGEMWLRGSPYGGQGLEHATTALRISERADLTSLAGFRIAPIVKIVHFPPELEERLRSIHWYRKYRGRMAQEVRLVPSNVRIYFHAKSTVGNDVKTVFDEFGIRDNDAALGFELNFVRTAVPMLTLFARTLRVDPPRSQYFGLDFHDVWLDKDAVLAPDGSVFFVDLEGIEEVGVERERVREKVEDQVYRSLYEFMFALEQIEAERVRRFGDAFDRKRHLRELFAEGLRADPFVRMSENGGDVQLEIRNSLGDAALYTTFPLVDG